MTSAGDEFEALFDEVAAQRVQTAAAAPAPAESEPAAPASSTTVEEAQATLENLADKPMFERLGTIVRIMHDSLRELGYDRSLSEVASQIGDAKGRLEYIATLTEQAANKVLNAIDVGMPEQENMVETAKGMEDRWNALFEGRMSVEEFKALAADSRQFAAKVAASAEAEKARLLDIMMAQDFQDITGQLIKKIVAITNKTEHELAQLLKDNAPPEMKAAIEAAEAKAAEEKPAELMQGPSVAGVALVQDDVDNLLAELGF
ncbi:MAG TPA: protein phosphatase CheZ [Paucimonas sp.]|nr:protein phosphatase CheZ [Paucimonas sp.]